MKRSAKLIFVFAFFLLNGTTNLLSAQNRMIDSLQNLLKTDKEDTNKVNHLNKLCREYLYTGDYDTSMLYVNEAFDLGKKINFPKGIANSYNHIGVIYWNQGNYSAALKNHFAALKIREGINDSLGISISYNNIGIVYNSQGNYNEALKKHFASMEIKKAMGDKAGMAFSYNNIGNIYERLGNYTKSLNNHYAALEIRKEMQNQEGIAMSYNNIGTVCAFLGKFDESLKNHFAALEIRIKIEDQNGIADSYSNIGQVYIDLAKGSDKKRNLLFAEEYLGKALELSLQIGNKEGIKISYKALSVLDSTKGNMKKAYEDYKMYIIYSDSLINEESTQKSLREQLNYEFGKKSAEDSVKNVKDIEVKNEKILAQNAQLEKEETFRYALFGGLLMVLLLSGFLVNRFRVTRAQSRLIELQKAEVDEKQKEILDSIHYAKRIQQSLLPTEKYIEKNLKRLKNDQIV